MSRVEHFGKYTARTMMGLEEYCTLLVPASQRKEYRNAYPNYEVAGVDDEIKGIGKTRQFALDHLHKEEHIVFFIDDDILIKTVYDGTRRRPSTRSEILTCFIRLWTWIEKPANNIAQAAIGSEFHFPQVEYDENRMCGMAFGVDTWAMKENSIRFDAVTVMEDVYVAMSLIMAGYKNRVTFKNVISNGPANVNGGCSLYRTPEMIRESIEVLSAKFPGFVTPYQRRHKYGDMTVDTPNARVHFKKAYKYVQGRKALSDGR